MKHLFIILSLILLSTSNGIAQNCQVNEDPFTNEKVITYNWKRGIVFYEQTKEHIKFGIKIHYSGERNVIIEKGTKVLFKLDNGDLLELHTCADAHPESQVSASQYSASVLTAYSFVFCITNQELKKLATHKLTAVRYPDTNGEPLDIILKGKRNKYSRAVNEGSQCIIEHSS